MNDDLDMIYCTYSVNDDLDMVYYSYSVNEGETWTNVEFSRSKLLIYGILSEPGEKTRIFSVFGSYPNSHQWIIIKIDLKSVFRELTSWHNLCINIIQGYSQTCLQGILQYLKESVPT